MRATLALVRFELERRWLALAAGLVIGVLDFVLPLLPGIHHSSPNELRGVAAGISAVSYGILLALALGGSLLANDLAERRASFLFARPIGATAMALGRFAVALLLVVFSTVLVLLPSYIAGARFEVPTGPWGDFGALALASGLFLLFATLLLLSSLIAVAARARSAWLVLEMTAVVFCGLCLELLRLEMESASFVFGAAVAAMVIAFAAYVASFVVGRTDLARAHRAQAIVSTSLLVAIGVVALGWAAS